MPKGAHKIKSARAKKSADVFLHLAFDNSVQPNIITIAESGKIIMANRSAGKLLGYSIKELLTKNSTDIFDIDERFTKMIAVRDTEGHATAIVSVVKNNGKLVTCETTSAIFRDESGMEKAIYVIAGISSAQGDRENENIDSKKKNS